MPLKTNVANELDAVTGSVDPDFSPAGEGFHAKLHNDANKAINELQAQGVEGPPGPEGPAGPQGDTGATGPEGPKGDTGAAGAAGAKGEKGDTGATGSTGPEGPKGTTGSPGPEGPKGEKGDKGDTGSTGPAGSTTIEGISGLQAALDSKLVKASNLSDVANAATARGNLGLGTAATQPSGAFDAAGAAAAAQAAAEGFATTADGLLIPKSAIDTDAAMAANSDTKVPSQKATKSALAGKADLAHASRHAFGGADQLDLPRYDPYDGLPYVIPMGLVPGTTVGPTAKRGYLNRFTVAKKREFKFVRWAVGTVGTGTEDKVEVSIYKVNGSKLERLGKSAATKTSFTTLGVRSTELSAAVTCEPGVVYFVGWTLEVITGTPQLLAILNNNGSVGDMVGTGTLANRLMLFKKELIPWPETIESPEGSTPTPYLLPSES